MKHRIGFGYDVHQLGRGHELWLGGIRIPYDKGLIGHSDADVLIHAICDSLLGAANLRDIGYQFPDTDPEFKDIDSKKLLLRVISLLEKNNFVVENIDTTVCLQKPRIARYIPGMQECLAGLLKIDKADISIKATTSEKLGFVGKEKGIEAYSVALIFQE